MTLLTDYGIFIAYVRHISPRLCLKYSPLSQPNPVTATTVTHARHLTLAHPAPACINLSTTGTWTGNQHSCHPNFLPQPRPQVSRSCTHPSEGPTNSADTESPGFIPNYTVALARPFLRPVFPDYQCFRRHPQQFVRPLHMNCSPQLMYGFRGIVPCSSPSCPELLTFFLISLWFPSPLFGLDLLLTWFSISGPWMWSPTDFVHAN